MFFYAHPDYSHVLYVPRVLCVCLVKPKCLTVVPIISLPANRFLSPLLLFPEPRAAARTPAFNMHALVHTNQFKSIN